MCQSRIKKHTNYCIDSLKYGDQLNNFGDLSGEFDVIAFFDKENVIFPIQVKLSNTYKRKEKLKHEWIAKNIINKAIEQVTKDLKLLSSKPGLKFIEKKLGFSEDINKPKIYPIIITDNFYVDHKSFVYNDKQDKVFVISYFEMKHLLCNEKIDNRQEFNVSKESPAKDIIDIIENNLFWNFITEEAEKFSVSKSTRTINDGNSIELKV